MQVWYFKVRSQLYKAGHGFQRWQDNLIAYRKTEDFLAKCLGGRTGGFDFLELGAKLF